MLYLLFKLYISIKYYIRHLSKNKAKQNCFPKLVMTDQINFREK